MENYDFLQCIDRGLGVFGDNIRQATYVNLTLQENISSDDIVANPDAFVKILKQVFGNGYPLAERSILREIRSTFSVDPAHAHSIRDAFEEAGKNISGYSPRQRSSVTPHQASRY
jgi:hypothetical protein